MRLLRVCRGGRIALLETPPLVDAIDLDADAQMKTGPAERPAKSGEGLGQRLVEQRLALHVLDLPEQYERAAEAAGRRRASHRSSDARGDARGHDDTDGSSGRRIGSLGRFFRLLDRVCGYAGRQRWRRLGRRRR